ncbi:MAG: ATP-grasp domain-containing protein [Anaerolineae bacterium]|nr:ATP-grasp domain-containing protein [Anaerolineae bacterium]
MSHEPKQSAVILVGLLSWQQSVITYIHRQWGCQAIALQPNSDEDYYVTLECDQVLRQNLLDEVAVCGTLEKLAETVSIAAVCTLNEYFVPLAAKLAAHFNLPGLALDAALNCRHKRRTREILARHHLASPRFVVVHSRAEVQEALLTVPLPVVVKPSNDSGSALVKRCETEMEVMTAVQAVLNHKTNALGLPMEPDVLIETYLSGPEVSVEACTIGGDTHILTITAKSIYSATKAFETKHTVPANLVPEQEAAVYRLITQTLAALGVDNGVTHTEVMLTEDGPYIVEVNARPGGDQISTLVRLARGYDLYEVAVHISMGGDLANLPSYLPLSKTATIQFFYAEEAGVVFRKRVPEVLPEGVYAFFPYYRTGNLVQETTSNYNRLGYVITLDTPLHNSAELAQKTLDLLELHVRTDWLTVMQWRLIGLFHYFREGLLRRQ